MDSPMCSRIENQAYRGKTDEELTTICGADREAFGELAQRYRAIAFRTAYFLLRNEQDAEDQVQTSLCKAWEHIGDFERRAKFSTWLVRIVVNQCLMQLRQSRRAVILSLDGSHRESAVFDIADEHSPEREVDKVYLSRLIKREMQRIPALLRTAFLVREVEGRPLAEVAERLGITVHATKSRLFRARQELRKRLEPHVLEHFTPGSLEPASTEAKPIKKGVTK
jgi:RNA polymerase sigma-70 factor (ECF subfamily)